MRTRLTTNPAEADTKPGFENKHVRLRHATTEALAKAMRASNARRGVIKCPACDWLEAHLDLDVIEAEKAIYQNPDWGPELICQCILYSSNIPKSPEIEHGDQIGRWLQHDASLELIKHPYERARARFEEMLKHRVLRFLGPEPAYICLAYLNQGHPNPRVMLERPAVREKFPIDLEVERFAAPTFDLA